MKKSCLTLGIGAVALASSLLCSAPLSANDYSISGESNTILRMRKTVDQNNVLPLYDYLRLNMTDNRSDGSGVDFNFGGWGRADLAQKSNATNPDGDIQYAYLTYHAAKNNSVVTIGRQFVSEGVAAERIDGLFLRSDLDFGFGASAFVGNSVVTQPLAYQPDYRGGALIYGGRVFQADKNYYTIGASALKSDRADKSHYREEEGVDLWLHPLSQVDLVGRSNYNNVTKGWMDNSYALSYSPLATLRLGADFSNINLKDYLANVTTSALSYLNPVLSINNRQNSYGASAAYIGIKNLTLAADYKFYSYDQSGNAAYFGGKVVYSLPESYTVGGAVHRMDGGIDKLRYMEYRAFASKKMGHTDLTVDATNTNYDNAVNGIKNSYTITGAAGYEVSHKLKVGADVEYSRNPDFNNDVRGLVKATYTFDTKSAAEGGTKSEK